AVGADHEQALAIGGGRGRGWYRDRGGRLGRPGRLGLFWQHELRRGDVAVRAARIAPDDPRAVDVRVVLRFGHLDHHELLTGRQVVAVDVAVSIPLVGPDHQ